MMTVLSWAFVGFLCVCVKTNEFYVNHVWKDADILTGLQKLIFGRIGRGKPTMGYDSQEDDNIKVYVRIRPPLKEVHDGGDLCLEVNSQNSVTISTKPEPKQFSYDHVADTKTTQEEVFATVGKGIIESFVNGFNGTIFAYGQTGSGKTFTMIGPPGDEQDTFAHELRGVIPRGFEYMFSLINREREKGGDRVEFIASCSFLEIYNEQVYDLLNPSTAGLQLRENHKKGVFVDGLTERDVVSAKDAYAVLESGWLNRRVASTSMNRESSRSHAVFTVSLSSKKRTGGMANIKISKLHLVDLAGSERQKDTNTKELRLKEAGSINKSLSALGNVIMALVDVAHGKQRHIHYRDSKLTFILRDSLGGNTRTYIIANIHPSSRCFGETLSTLNFARRAKMIKNKAVVNEDVTGNVSELQAEIKKLKEMLNQSKLCGPGLEVKPLENTAMTAERSVGDGGGDDHWKEMMMHAIQVREQAEAEKNSLQRKVVHLEELCHKKDLFAQSQKMIIKFRNETIAKMKAPRNTDPDDEKDLQIKALKEEIKVLTSTIEHHPEVKRLAIENLECRAEIKRLKSMDPSNGSYTKNMVEKHRYTLQLERQIHDIVTNQTKNTNDESRESQLNADYEKLKLELNQVQSRFDSQLQEFKLQERKMKEKSEMVVVISENSRQKELDLKAELVAVRKSNNELERALETYQLKTAVERSALNSLHIQTIRSLSSSPLKFGTPSKKSSIMTPNSHLIGSARKNIAFSSPLKPSGSNGAEKKSPVFLEDERPPEIMNERGSDDEFDPFWNFGDETCDEETEYMESIRKEMLHLQNLYNETISALQKEQMLKIVLNEKLTKSEHKYRDIEQLFTTRKGEWQAKEVEFTEQLDSIRDQYSQTQNKHTILASEFDDMRELLSNTQKQLHVLDKKKEDGDIEASRKYANLESKFVKLEIDFMNQQNEMESTMEANSHLQAGYEECKDELEFLRHKNTEQEGTIENYKQKLKLEEEKLQSTLEKLNTELEMKIKLSQEDKEQELMKSVETISTLREELSTARKELDNQRKETERLIKDLQSSRGEVATQIKLNTSDKEAISKFMRSIEELNETIGQKEDLVSTLNIELEEIKQQLANLQQQHQNKVDEYDKLVEDGDSRLAQERSKSEKREKQVNEEICTLKLQIKETATTVEEKEERLQALVNENKDLKDSLAAQSSVITSLECELEDLKNMSTVFVEKLEEKQSTPSKKQTDELDSLREQISEYEVVQSGQYALEQRMKCLETALEDKEAEKKIDNQKIEVLQEDIQKCRGDLQRENKRIEEFEVQKNNSIKENQKLLEEFEQYKVNFVNLQEDLEANLEELEKTKMLEERYFNEKTSLQSRVESSEEERQRFAQKIEELLKTNEQLQEENTRLAGHHNHSQRISILMDLKKERQELKDENEVLRSELNLLKRKCSDS